MLIVDIAEVFVLISEVLVEMLEVFDAISVSLDAMLEVLVLILDSTSDRSPTAKVPSTVASELNVVALATVPPVNALPSTAVPFHQEYHYYLLMRYRLYKGCWLLRIIENSNSSKLS